MGKVTIIVQSPHMGTLELEHLINTRLVINNLVPEHSLKFGTDVDIFVVPDDEEYPSLD